MSDYIARKVISSLPQEEMGIVVGFIISPSLP